MRSRALRVAVLAASTVVLASLGLVGLAAPAQATSPTTTTVTVQVTSKTGAALTDVTVEAVPLVDGSVPEGAYPTYVPPTSKPGVFSSALASDQTYTILFLAGKKSGASSFSQFLGGTSDLRDAETFTPATQSSFRVSLAGNAVISGTVSPPSGGKSRVSTVVAYRWDGAAWSEFSHVESTSAGKYSLTDLDAGSYKLRFLPYDEGLQSAGPYRPFYSGSSTSLGGAKIYSIATGQSLTVNASFTKAGTGGIKGTAYNRWLGPGTTSGFASETPIAIPVVSVDGTEQLDADDEIAGAPMTYASEGAWSIAGLSPGNYVVVFSPFGLDTGNGEGYVYLGDNNQLFPSPTQAKEIAVSSSTVQTGSAILQNPSDFTDVHATFDIEAVGAALPANTLVTLTSLTSPHRSQTGEPFAEIEPGSSRQVGLVLPFGDYLLTAVDPSGQHEPFVDPDFTLFSSDVDYGISLDPTTTAPGFDSPPTIAEANTTVGTPYTVAFSASRGDAVPSFQWYRDSQRIDGANAATYVSTGADAGKQLSVKVTLSSFGFSDVSATAQVTSGVETLAPAASNTTAPSVSPSGTVHIGQTLIADAGVWDAEGLTYHYQWLRDGTPIGSDAPTYTVGATDTTQAGSAITVVVTTSAPGREPSEGVASTTTATAKTYAAPTQTKAPSFTSKKNKTGTTTFTMKPGTWSVSGLSIGDVWQDGSTTYSGCSTSCTISSDDLTSGEPINVIETATKPGYDIGTAEANVVKGAAWYVQHNPQYFDDTQGAPIGTDNDPMPIVVGDTLIISQGGVFTNSALSDDGESGPTTVSYSWSRISSKGVATVVSTADHYVVSPSDYNYTLRVSATGSSFGYPGEPSSVTLGQVTASSALTDAPATVAVSPAAPAPGGSVKAVVGAWPVSGVSTGYQWFVGASGDAMTPVKGATKSSFTLPKSGVNYVKVGITGSRTGYLPVTSDQSDAISVNYGKAATAPKLIHASDDSWSVTPGAYSPAGGTETYSWLVNGSPDGTTASTHAAVGQTDGLAVIATYESGDGLAHVSTTLVGRKAVPSVATGDDAETITGTHYGQTLGLSKAAPFTDGDATPGALSYQWYSAGKAIKGATKSTWTPTSSYIGKSIYAVAKTASTSLFNAASAQTPTMTLGHAQFTGLAVSVTSNHPDDVVGGATPGAVLTAHLTGTVPKGAKVAYQWRNNLGNIAGQTKSTYTVTSTDAGEGWDLTVAVTITETGTYDPVQLFGSGGSANGWNTIASLSAPQLSGAAKVGGTLSVTKGTWNDTYAPTQFSYQWYRNGAAIPGATSTTFVLPPGSAGDDVYAVVTGAIPGYSSAAAPSDHVVVADGDAPIATGGKVSWTASTRTATITMPSWTIGGLEYVFHWMVGGVDASGTGQGTDTFIADGSQHGVLAVTITATRSGYANGAATLAGPTL